MRSLQVCVLLLGLYSAVSIIAPFSSALENTPIDVVSRGVRELMQRESLTAAQDSAIQAVIHKGYLAYLDDRGNQMLAEAKGWMVATALSFFCLWTLRRNNRPTSR